MNTECIIASFIKYVSDFPNRQAELEAQAFPNRVWERESMPNLEFITWGKNLMFRILTALTALIFIIPCAKADTIDYEALEQCQLAAKILNKSGKVNINLNELRTLVTWRASCAEEKPTDKGNVMALCEGTSVRSDGKGELLFFWLKTYRGKVNTGFIICSSEE
jgi:hypothetical protein